MRRYLSQENSVFIWSGENLFDGEDKDNTENIGDAQFFAFWTKVGFEFGNLLMFLFYKLTIMSGLNMFYIHLLIGLISSKKYCRAAKNLVLALKVIIKVKLIFYEILTKIQKK